MITATEAYTEVHGPVRPKIDPDTIDDPDLRRILQTPIAELPLKYRYVETLERSGSIYTVNDLLHYTRDELASLYDVGPALIRDVFAALKAIGLPANVVDAALAAMRLPRKYFLKPIVYPRARVTVVKQPQ